MSDDSINKDVIKDDSVEYTSTKGHYQLGIVLLAAGASRRFHGIKQLADLGNNTMLQMALNKQSHLPAVKRIVALGANNELIKQHIEVPENVHVCHVKNWQTGIAASIGAGICELENCSHVLIMLADQPQLQISSYTQLIAASRCNLGSIVCAFYRQKNAVPAIFPKPCLSFLQQLKGDMGAGRFLNSSDREQKLLSIPMELGAFDIDTPQDLFDWRQNDNNIKNEIEG